MMTALSTEDHDVTLSSGLNVLIFRVAESPACQQFQPELEEFVRRHPEHPVWTVEAMQQRDLADRHGLRALPSIVVYREGLPARRFAGGMTADDLAREVAEVASADLDEEYNDWMLWMLETGEAGSPFIGPRLSSAADGQPRPTSPSQHLKAADAAWYTGDDAAAILHFTAVLAMEPTSPDALSGRGQVLTDGGAGAAGLTDLDRLLASDPDPVIEAYARSARAYALAQVGRQDEADQEMAVALASSPDSAWAFLRKARIEILRGNASSAVPLLHRALEASDPALTQTQRALAESLLRAD